MKNVSEWKPTKIKKKGNCFYVNELGIASGSLYITLEAFRVVNLYKSYLQGTLVDLGCGNVPYYEWYKERVDQVICVDWTQSPHEAKYVDIFANLNQNLPLKDNSVDSIFCTSVLEHICDPLLLFKEINRILKQDGYLLLSVPFLYHLHEEPFDYYRYTPHGLKYLAEQAGLEVVSFKNYGSAFGVLIDVFSKTLQVFIMTICNIMPPSIAKLTEQIGNSLLRLFQQICFHILKIPQIIYFIEKINLSSRIALGYVAVYKIKQDDNFR